MLYLIINTELVSTVLQMEDLLLTLNKDTLKILEIIEYWAVP